MGFWLKLPLLWRIVSIAALAGGLLWGKTWYDNRQRNLGAARERARLLEAIGVASEEQWKEQAEKLAAEQAQIDALRGQIDTQRRLLEEDRASIANERTRLRNEIRRSAAEFVRRLEESSASAATVDSSELDVAIAGALAEHRRRDDPPRDPVPPH